MVYSQQNSKGRTYYLHAKNVRLRNGRTQRIFFFSPKEDQDESLPEVPPQFMVDENSRTGLLFLKKKA
jgi:hypothetical protein